MNVWQFIYNKKIAAVNVMLLYVLESAGSSPGRRGFKMAVASDGAFCGTIGGGIMEFKFVEMAKAKLQDEMSGAAVYTQVHDKAALKNQSGMICSGEQTIFLYQVQATDLIAVKALLDSLQAHANGRLQLSNSGICFSAEVPAVAYHFEKYAEDFLLIEKTGYKQQLHIIGGGHCALAFSRLMRSMDFYIYLYEERAGLNTFVRNRYVHERILLPSYAALDNIISGAGDAYVVIMTFGYRSDDVALRALLGKEFKYIGMLGSKKKIEKMFTAYRAEKLDENHLRVVHSPIGIQVKSQTTAEIAVSIAAEIIAVKNRDQ